MSGGSFDYMYAKIRSMYENEFDDDEMEDLFQDFCDILHDLEWWQSGDIGDETYRERVTAFKKKWLSGHNEDTDARVERLKHNLIEAINKFR